MNIKPDYKIGIIRNGFLRGDVCIVLYECNYISSDKLKWFKILVNNRVLSMSNNNINLL
jgi:hypothetical protein